jgi:hypothetical protein
MVGAHSVLVQFAKCQISACPVRSVKGRAGDCLYPVQTEEVGQAGGGGAGPIRRCRTAAFMQLSSDKCSTSLFPSLGLAVTARVKPQYAHHIRCRLPVVTPLRWYRESINPDVPPVHPSVRLGRVESASTVQCLTITRDLLQAAGQRADCFAMSLSTDSVS